jgi:small-conductance mechanosensitive channel
MATFLGLLSAGVAVALQYVILAVLGYFALSGKRGMKVGDLVTISGVTGEVINLGLLQFQIRELDGSSLASTNNVVTFSNSFIFISPQTGFSKVIPVDQSNIQSSAAISRS